MARHHILRLGFTALLALTVQACTTTLPARQADQPGVDDGRAVLAAAAGVIGAPYSYGGSSPQGFDCSGLVYYAHRRAGISVPRTTGAQLRQAQPVALGDVRIGDVLFFELEGDKVSHVGIYAGAGRFIHAPSSGKHVAYAQWTSPFWKSHLVGAGRFD
jgi:cell wall-associated NlpC family hydrolase